MKKPKLEFKQVWIVEGWQTESRTGMGTFFPPTEKYSDFNESWLVFFDGETYPKKFYKSVVFENEVQAEAELTRQKASYAKYLKEEIERQQQELKKINFL